VPCAAGAPTLLTFTTGGGPPGELGRLALLLGRGAAAADAAPIPRMAFGLVSTAIVLGAIGAGGGLISVGAGA
jgi:hypothetical protein